jgi:uncharacterized membrane protein YfcA
MIFGLEWQLILELLLLGLFTGFLAGLLGIGGGMLLVPFMTILLAAKGMPEQYVVKIAIATSLATICFTSVSSVRSHHKRGAVRWDVVKMLLDRKPKPTRQLPEGAGMVGSGAGIGLLSSLVGAGGGFISVPFMTWCNVPIHNAVATSAALGFPIALAGTVGYVVAGWTLHDMPYGTLGFIYLPALLLIAVASVLTAPLGVRTAHRLNVAQLKRAFAMLLYVLAVYMLYKGIHD